MRALEGFAEGVREYLCICAGGVFCSLLDGKVIC